MPAVLTAVNPTDSVVLIRGEELRAGGRETLFVVALEAGQDALTKQVFTRLLLQEMVETQIVWLLGLLFAHILKIKTLQVFQMKRLFCSDALCF